MEKLRNVIKQYGRWSALEVYAERIETFLLTDFSQSLENAKALLETVGKEICQSKGADLGATPSLSGTLKTAFAVIGYPADDMV